LGQDFKVKARKSQSSQAEELREKTSSGILVVGDSPDILNLLTEIFIYH